MRIIIVGGGQVGTEISARLSKEHDVVIIEQSAKISSQIENQLDVLLVEGNGASCSILEKAGIKKTELLVAVTEIDEVNIISCMLAKNYGVPKTVARIRNPEYAQGENILTNEQLGINYIINPEDITAQEIKKSIDFPEVNEIEYYADGTIKMVGLTINPEDVVTNVPLKDIPMPQNSIICAIVRENGEVLVPGGYDVMLPGDEVYILDKRDINIDQSIFKRKEKKNHNIIIAGGGRVGFRLAELLEKTPDHNFKVKIIDKDIERCRKIAEKLSQTIVLNGDVTNHNFLKSEEIENADVFVAVTGDDEVNLLSTLLAKKLGARRTVSEVIRPDYNIILNSINIDKVVSPRLLTASRIMRLILKGDIINLTILKEEKAEIVEIMLPSNAAICGKELRTASLPKGVLVGAISRQGNVFVPRGNDRLLADDRIVVFTLHHLMSSIEKLFSSPTKS